MIPLIVLMLIPMIVTALMAWKKMDVDEAYSESKWIFSMIVTQLEVVLVAVLASGLHSARCFDGRSIPRVYVYALDLPNDYALDDLSPQVHQLPKRPSRHGQHQQGCSGERTWWWWCGCVRNFQEEFQPHETPKPNSSLESRASQEPETHMLCGTSIPEEVPLSYDSHDQESHQPDKVVADQPDGVIDNLKSSDSSTRGAVLEESENGNASEIIVDNSA